MAGMTVTTKPIALVLAAAALACAAWAPQARAGTYDRSYQADPGETNSITASSDGAYLLITDTAGIVNTGGADTGCVTQTANTIRCPIQAPFSGFNRFLFFLDDGNDSFIFTGPAPPLPAGYENYGEGPFSVAGEAGDDNLQGSPYADELYGSYSIDPTPGTHDVLNGNAGDDSISGGDGANDIDGGPGQDHIRGSDGADSISAGDGDDYIEGHGGADGINGDAGNDNVYGGAGNDTMHGGAGNDDVEGNDDRDAAFGDGGNDDLSATFHGGCGGPDSFDGGAGKDSLYVYCGEPTIMFKDGVAEQGECKPKARPASVQKDKSDDLKNCGGKKKKKKKKRKHKHQHKN